MRTVLARWCAAIAVVLAAMPTSAQTPSTDPQPLTIDGATSYVYKTGDKYELRLHAFKPDPPNGRSKAAAIVFFFGGGFRNGSVWQLVPHGRYFADRGMVAIVADYRVSDRHGTNALEAIADAKSAMRWVRAHSSQLGIDPNRIAASGVSSGGLLALTAAVLDDFDEAGEDKTVSSKPNALVLFSTGVGTKPAAPPGTSPMQHLRRGLPPTLILHGKADATVPYADVERFCAESKALGNDCQMVGYEGAPHGFVNPNRFDGKWYRETLQEADRFLTRLGYVPKPTPSPMKR